MYLNSFSIVKSSCPKHVKQEHEMYLNIINSSPLSVLKTVKQEHEMYLNLKEFIVFFRADNC